MMRRMYAGRFHDFEGACDLDCSSERRVIQKLQLIEKPFSDRLAGGRKLSPDIPQMQQYRMHRKYFQFLLLNLDYIFTRNDVIIT